LQGKGLETLEVGFGGFELGEEALFGLELAGVDAAAAGFDADGMFEVEHLVVEEVLDGAARGVGTVKDAADDDGVVGGVVVAEHAAGVVGGPGEGGTAEESVEEAGVERFEDFVEVVVMAGGGGEAFAAAGLANVFGLAGDGLGGDVAAVAVCVGGGDGLLVKLGQENVGDGVVDGVWRRLEQVGEADVETAFAQADGGIEGGEAAEADVERRDGGAGAEFAVLLFENGYEGGGGGGLGFCGAGLTRCVRASRSCGWRGGEVVEQSGRGRREELQKLAQGGGAGMLRGGQGFVLVLVLQDDFIRGEAVEECVGRFAYVLPDGPPARRAGVRTPF
jgi:hypothetical protein